MKTLTLYFRGIPIVHKPISRPQIHIGTTHDNDLIVASSTLRDCRVTVEMNEHGKWQSRVEGNNACISPIAEEMLPGKRIELGEYEIGLSTIFTGSPTPGADQLNLIGNTAAMQQLRHRIRQMGPLQGPVLIEGESGTGKELTARALHQCSKRKMEPFVAVNCGSITDSMAEDIFFGHNRGAFTGASQQHRGVFEQANGGTLFLDEIGELPLCHQAALLRVLDTRTVCRIGAEQATRIDFRLIAATNRDLKKMVNDGSFRLDLYHRISTLQLQPPPLRTRKDDIELLSNFFLMEMQSDVGQKALSDEALKKLKDYPWPGNCRELKNVLYKSAALTAGITLSAEDVELGTEDRVIRIRQLDDEIITQEMCRLDGNVSAVARALNIPRTTLRNRLKLLKSHVIVDSSSQGATVYPRERDGRPVPAESFDFSFSTASSSQH